MVDTKPFLLGLLFKIKKIVLMLHYSKMILERMTIDSKLFKKELKKAYNRLSNEDAYELYQWARNRYPELVLDLSPSYYKNMAS